MTDKIKIENHTFGGALWFAGWLFTIGFLDLRVVRAVLAIVVWPYYLGVRVAQMLAAGG